MPGTKGLLKTVKSFGKRSGSYESLTEADVSPARLRNGTRSRLPDDIPQGYLAVYVGNERKRFVISTQYLSHSLFKALLKKSEEEFGFEHQGGLPIACEPDLFEHLLWLIGTNSPAAETTQLDELVDLYTSF
ncbi:hypothetical protein R1flu_001825 [Riccia fluitans]|uniref:Small auxin up regulated protein n=1 Tax=Riccia fluitans TaxID=41844 RepID=A0ABD1Y4V8_9MARC